MQSRTIFVAAAAAFAGLVAGFLLSNSINRNEMSSLRAENELLKKERPAPNPTEITLTDDEIAGTIRRAESNPGDAQAQRNIGVSLYRYGATKQDAELIRQSIRILERAASLRPDDQDVNLTLGHAYFDVGYFTKNNEAFTEARKYYAKVLDAKPASPDVLVDFGLTYYLQTPPDYERSVEEFRRSLAADPKHEKTLQYMVQALIKLKKPAEASEFLQRLREVNPRNDSIAESTSLIADLQRAG